MSEGFFFVRLLFFFDHTVWSVSGIVVRVIRHSRGITGHIGILTR